VDEPAKYIVYYSVLLIFFGLSVGIGKRGACHAICWMSPFLTAGAFVGRKLRLPQLHIRADVHSCIRCGRCKAKCPMSLDVPELLEKGVHAPDCILCGECVDACPKKVLRYGFRR